MTDRRFHQRSTEAYGKLCAVKNALPIRPTPTRKEP